MLPNLYCALSSSSLPSQPLCNDCASHTAQTRANARIIVTPIEVSQKLLEVGARVEGGMGGTIWKIAALGVALSN
jgi:hypothetical protein